VLCSQYFVFAFAKYNVQSTKFAFSNLRFENAHKFSGGCVERATPVPIPNTEVKPLGADGTARATVWESRKPPGLLMKARERNLAGFLVFHDSSFDYSVAFLVR
jgi:hypothetical protein